MRSIRYTCYRTQNGWLRFKIVGLRFPVKLDCLENSTMSFLYLCIFATPCQICNIAQKPYFTCQCSIRKKWTSLQLKTLLVFLLGIRYTWYLDIQPNPHVGTREINKKNFGFHIIFHPTQECFLNWHAV